MARFSYFSVFLVFLIPAIGGLLFGYEIGATSYTIVQIKDSALSGTKWATNVNNSPFLSGLISSAAVFGAFIGSVIVFVVADKIGRKRELQIGSLLYIIGAVSMFLVCNNSFSPSVGIPFIVIARLIFGVGIAFTMHGAPTYIGEMSPPSVRGILVSMKEAMIVVGILCGYGIGFILENTEGGWGYMYGCSSLLSSAMFLGTFAIPRSARWLLYNSRYEEAIDSVKFVFKGDGTMDLFDDMRQQVDEQREASVLTGNKDSNNVFAKKWRGPLIAGVGLVFLQQITGQPSILSYATPILTDAGLGTYAPVLIGSFKFIATMYAVFNVEKYGRKKLLYIGNFLMLVALITLSVTFFFDEHKSSDDSSDDLGTSQIVILVAMFTYIGGYQVGFGPISWLMISEVFPLEVRGQAVAFAVQTNFFWNTVVQFSVPVVQDYVGTFPLFCAFTCLCAYSIYFVSKYVPETKGLTLEEIEKFFEEQTMRERTTSMDNETPLLSTVAVQM